MTSDVNSPDTQTQQDDSSATTSVERKRISRIADEAAGRARDRQQRYDEGHTIFTK
jgi:hypothetical protein